MISNLPFDEFKPKFSAAGCFIEHNRKILLLKYPETKKDNPGRWGSPAGKIDDGETPKDAVIRETYEEIGYHLDPRKIIFVEKAYVRYSDFDFIYNIFRYTIESNEKPQIILKEREHTTYKWATIEEALKEDLVYDDDYCIRAAYNLIDRIKKQ